MAEIVMGGKYIRQCDSDEKGQPVPDAKEVVILTTTLDDSYSVLYQIDGRCYSTNKNGLSPAYPSCDILPYPEPPKFIPWSSIDEIPCCSLFRFEQKDVRYPISGFSERNSTIRIDGAWYSLFSLYSDWAYSLDNGKTWRVCGKLCQN